jgi:hypothetical protein
MIVWNGSESLNAFWLSNEYKYGILCEDNVSAYTIRTLFNSNEVIAICGSGWKFVFTKIMELQSLCTTKKKKIIGFIDRDYWFLKDDQKILERSDIVHTDFRDIEIDLLHSDAFADFISLKKPILIGKHIELRNNALTNLSNIGLLRAYSHKLGKFWEFPPINKHIRKSIFNYDKWEINFKQVNKISKSHMDEFNKWKSSLELDPKIIVRGHDAIQYLHTILDIQLDQPKTKNSSVLTIEDCLACCI